MDIISFNNFMGSINMVFEEDPIELTDEVYKLYLEQKYVEALKLHAKVLNRRRGSCSIWRAEEDISGAILIAEEGKINLKLPSFVYNERSMHAMATWKAVDAVVNAIEKL